jgi:hypothetical protein
MGGKVIAEEVQRGAFAVDDDTVAIKQDGGGASHSGAVSRVTMVSP